MNYLFIQRKGKQEGTELQYQSCNVITLFRSWPIRQIPHGKREYALQYLSSGFYILLQSFLHKTFWFLDAAANNETVARYLQ